MKKIYCKLNELHKYKIIDEYPNPQIKICIKGEIKYRLHIIYPNDKIIVTKLNKYQALYHTGKDIDITTLNLNWLPKSEIVGVNENLYSENTELSKFTGYVKSSDLGSNTEAFLTSKVKNAINILTNLGFEIDLKKSAEKSIINKWNFILSEKGLTNIRIYIENENVDLNFANFAKSNFLQNPETIIILNNMEKFKIAVIGKIKKELKNFKI